MEHFRKHPNAASGAAVYQPMETETTSPPAQRRRYSGIDVSSAATGINRQLQNMALEEGDSLRDGSSRKRPAQTSPEPAQRVVEHNPLAAPSIINMSSDLKNTEQTISDAEIFLGSYKTRICDQTYSYLESLLNQAKQHYGISEIKHAEYLQATAHKTEKRQRSTTLRFVERQQRGDRLPHYVQPTDVDRNKLLSIRATIGAECVEAMFHLNKLNIIVKDLRQRFHAADAIQQSLISSRDELYQKGRTLAENIKEEEEQIALEETDENSRPFCYQGLDLAKGIFNVGSVAVGESLRAGQRAWYHQSFQPDDMKRILSNCGVLSSKVAQVFASWPGIPAGYHRVLQSMLERNRSVPWPTVKATVEDSLRKQNKRFSEVFSSFSEEPVKVGTVCQIHHAVLKNFQNSVAVKVLKPSVKDELRQSAVLCKQVFKTTNWLMAENKGQLLCNMLCEYVDSTVFECDLERELRFMEYYRRVIVALGINGKIILPQTYEDLSDKNMLVMDFIEGPSLAELINTDPEVARTSVLKAISAWTDVARYSGLVHGDMHAGNIIMKKGVPHLIDFANMAWAQPGVVEFFSDENLFKKLSITSGYASTGDDKEDQKARLLITIKHLGGMMTGPDGQPLNDEQALDIRDHILSLFSGGQFTDTEVFSKGLIFTFLERARVQHKMAIPHDTMTMMKSIIMMFSLYQYSDECAGVMSKSRQ